MEQFAYYVAGFASGWAVRTTVDSSRALAVKVLSGLYGVVDRAGRAFGMEREYLEDLLAEARAKYEADRARAGRSVRDQPDGVSSPVAVEDRAA